MTSKSYSASSEDQQLGLFMDAEVGIHTKYSAEHDIILCHGDAASALSMCPDGFAAMIITSPPYNLGKVYEKQTGLESYLAEMANIIEQIVRVLSPRGSLCWQVGNYVEDSEVFPLDVYYYNIFKKHGLKLRNRIVWTFEHGLHCTRRFSGRYETLLWFTRGDEYTFNLDPVRVPSKYPGKTNFRPGPKYGMPSGNPLGKNPSDVWKFLQNEWDTGMWSIPNVKANHPEKTLHPCQFPIELVERCVLAMTDVDDLVLDPFCGVGSSLLASIMHGRRTMGCEKEREYVAEARRRIRLFFSGKLPYRPLGKPVYQPTGKDKVSQIPPQWIKER